MQFVKSNIDDPSDVHSAGCYTESSWVHLVAGIPTGHTFHLQVVTWLWLGKASKHSKRHILLVFVSQSCHFLVGQFKWLEKEWETEPQIWHRFILSLGKRLHEPLRPSAFWKSMAIAQPKLGHQKNHQLQVQQVRHREVFLSNEIHEFGLTPLLKVRGESKDWDFAEMFPL